MATALESKHSPTDGWADSGRQQTFVKALARLNEGRIAFDAELIDHMAMPNRDFALFAFRSLLFGKQQKRNSHAESLTDRTTKNTKCFGTTNASHTKAVQVAINTAIQHLSVRRFFMKITFLYRTIVGSPRGGATQKIVLDVDQYGSPVSLKEACWFVCFVPGLRKQWWHCLVLGSHKHVFAMRPEPSGMWTLFEPWWRRLMNVSLSAEQARDFLAWASIGDVLLVREMIPGRGSQFRGWANCAVLVSFLLGRGYKTWTPRGFYRCLIRERGVRRINISLLLALELEELEAATKIIASHNWHDDDGAL